MTDLTHFALVSDIHGNLPALEVVTADLKSRRINTVINLGDHLSGPLWPLETARFLMQQDWIHITGNHDRKTVSQPPAEHNPSDRYAYQSISGVELAWLGSLPADLHLGEQIFLFHGAPGSDTTYLLENIVNERLSLAAPADIRARLKDVKTPLLLCGHTHKTRVVLMDDGQLIVNPGSVGLPAYSDDTPVFHVCENGSPHARYAVLEKSPAGWKVELISLMYDYKKAAERARLNNRPDWQHCLLTGFAR
ncbi:MAG: metallophosphatase family protein [Anaerolineae bacterium]|nr:metallophosphatase family protein [Anaerolineae bacterium]